MKHRAPALEIMDDPSVPDDVWEKFHQDLSRLERVLGCHRTVIRALREDSPPAASVLDIGCGSGMLLRKIRQDLGVPVAGIDLRAPRNAEPGIPITMTDAVRDPLPRADVAVSVYLVHHLCERSIVDLIRNVALTSRRLILLDLVRHWLPLVLFSAFLGPLFGLIVHADGCQSIRRAYTPGELRTLVEEAIHGSGARVRYSVSPWYASQLVDITWS
ncbi:MAG: methyltransferase domain-containing protein [Candidatus Solibacter usitatus]|nr:methyltransferase domain-containing protein [Candidatus Solibacter usitatus]